MTSLNTEMKLDGIDLTIPNTGERVGRIEWESESGQWILRMYTARDGFAFVARMYSREAAEFRALSEHVESLARAEAAERDSANELDEYNTQQASENLYQAKSVKCTRKHFCAYQAD